MRIVPDDLTGPAIKALLDEHLVDMRAISPPDAVFALDLEGLRSPEVTFWSVHDRDELLGCGALKEIDPRTGEIKSMRTSNAHRGRGAGTAMLRHIISVARARGYGRLYLETGTSDHFRAARDLYARHGFVDCGPFATYEGHPHSAFMVLELDPASVETDPP